ncbi:SGNH/GDSL hydrolase family protein [Streptomyces griseiscabiei]|uniref:SGNH/GDSL hydrolase family protein n=1 Tax=Streptomyces griseiscabiei TaxID=2993540 RepID=A0ABU4LFP0_9ACTN|nr:SGNH/GDSL hydrolase family protein [Streptomyces griseiscabiei]MDX2914601.1 SGNH/GDSL hydrolase family protein [Streptomyces griseiscabiei]
MGNGLTGKSVYAFGDSIVYGHVYPRSFADLVTEQESMNLTKLARNGATIGADPHASGGQILAQIEDAPAAAPDFVLFGGGTNDAQSNFRDHAYELAVYAEAVERTLHTASRRWPTAHIVYVTAHKLGSRDWDTQVALREITLRACHAWGVAVADVFADTNFDTREDAQRVTYTFDNLVDGFPGTGGTGTHPNMAVMTEFYGPVVRARMRQMVTH